MENKIFEKIKCEHKKYMPAFAVLLAALVFILILFFAVEISNRIKEGRYIGQDAVFKNTISVTATGKVYAKPDLAQASFSVTEEAETVAEAMAANTTKMNAVIDFIKNQGTEDKDLKTTVFSISPRYEWKKSGERILAGYEVFQSLEVKIRDLSKVGSIIEGAAENGANQVGNLYFAIDDQDKLKSEARQKAIDEAKSKAQILVSQLGVGLGKITNFSESEFGGPVPFPYFAKAEAIGGGETPQIETGENKIEVTVTITYEIN